MKGLAVVILFWSAIAGMIYLLDHHPNILMWIVLGGVFTYISIAIGYAAENF